MKLIIVAFVAGALSACATTQQEQVNVQQLVGDRYVGQPILAMNGRYGAPLRKMEMGDDTVYSWEVNRDLVIGGAPLHLHCQLDAYVTSAGMVRTLGVSGNQGACVSFIP